MSAKVVVYSISAAPVSYIGEVVALDHASGILQLTRCLVLVTAPRQRGAQPEADDRISISAVPFASRESTITLRMSDVAGLLTENPDEDLVKQYESQVVSLYSKLSLVGI